MKSKSKVSISMPGPVSSSLALTHGEVNSSYRLSSLTADFHRRPLRCGRRMTDVCTNKKIYHCLDRLNVQN